MKSKFLQGNFYSVVKAEFLTTENNELSVHVSLNPDHSVYQGHFPELPVAPGVGLIGMIQEILEQQLHKKLFMSEASDIKFMKLILPNEQNVFEVSYSLKYHTEKIIETSAIMRSGNDIYLKLKCKFTVLPFQS